MKSVCTNCKHIKYCKIKHELGDTDFLVYCPIKHIRTYKHFKKAEREYLQALEERRNEQTTLEGVISQ